MGEITPTKVTHGKTEADNEADFAAAHAIDGYLSTKSVTSTDNGAGWLRIDLDKTYPINKVLIYYMFVTSWYNPDSWCPKSESNFRTCVDQESNVNVKVYRGDVQQKSCETLQLTYGLEQSDQIYSLICNARGDNVILSKTSYLMEVCEVVVISSGK